jgi:hypothetical protein
MGDNNGVKQTKAEAVDKPVISGGATARRRFMDNVRGAASYAAAIFILGIFPSIVTGVYGLVMIMIKSPAKARTTLLDPNYYNLSFEALLVAFGILAAITTRRWGPNVGGHLVILVICSIVVFALSTLLPKLSVIPSDMYSVTVVLPNVISMAMVAVAVGVER